MLNLIQDCSCENGRDRSSFLGGGERRAAIATIYRTLGCRTGRSQPVDQPTATTTTSCTYVASACGKRVCDRDIEVAYRQTAAHAYSRQRVKQAVYFRQPKTTAVSSPAKMIHLVIILALSLAVQGRWRRVLSLRTCPTRWASLWPCGKFVTVL